MMSLVFGDRIYTRKTTSLTIPWALVILAGILLLPAGKDLSPKKRKLSQKSGNFKHSHQLITMMIFRNRLQISLQILHETVTYYIKNHSFSFRYKKNFHYCQSYCVLMICHSSNNPANICLFKVNNRNTKKRCEISSKLTIIKTLELRQWLFMVLLYLALNIFHTFITSPLFLT